VSGPGLDKSRVPGAARRCRDHLLPDDDDDDDDAAAAAAAAGPATGVWLRRRRRQGRDHRVHHADDRRPVRAHGGPQRYRGESEEDYLQEAEGRQGAHLLAAPREVSLFLSSLFFESLLPFLLLLLLPLPLYLSREE